MATFFGEILQDFSRAVDDDDDEDDDDSTEIIECRLQWSAAVHGELGGLPDHRLPCRVLIVAVGAAAVGFVQAYMLTDDYEVVGALHSSKAAIDVTTLKEMSPTDRTTHIYRSRRSPDVFLCLCATSVNPEQSHSWVNQLFSGIDVASSQFYLTILSSCMTSEYKSEVSISDLKPPFLRALKTTRYPGTTECPYLEQPNLVPGLPAQLLTHCQIMNMKAVLYICYTDSIYLDIPTVKMFLPFLKATPVKDIVQEKSVSEYTVKQVVELYSVKNNLYL